MPFLSRPSGLPAMINKKKEYIAFRCVLSKRIYINPAVNGIRPSASREIPSQHSKIPLRCDIQTRGRSGDRKIERRLVF